MVHANMLLFIVPHAENNRLIITGKLFEYMASGTPMLSIGPVDGDASQLIAEGNRGPMVDYLDKEGIKSALRRQYSLWKKDNRKKAFHKEDELMQFSRRELTKKLSDLLNSLVK
jgi:glycosyltransferase involved in cell wall biosynthesis